jgi:hypothetical protein
MQFLLIPALILMAQMVDVTSGPRCQPCGAAACGPTTPAPAAYWSATAVIIAAFTAATLVGAVPTIVTCRGRWH